MGVYLNAGNAEFSSAVNSEIYVDKTEMLEYLNSILGTEQRYVCVSRPRRFGKSIAARMVAAYYNKGCDSRDLFSGHAIATSNSFETHLNKYNVIQLDISYLRTKVSSAMEAIEYLQKEIIDELRSVYPEYIGDKVTFLPDALEKINNGTGERFIIVIDEWDHFFREDRYDYESQDAYINLLRSLFKGGPSQRFILLAYITGILPLKRYSSESALNNFKEHTMTSPKRLAKYVGFTEAEVKALCKQYGMDFQETQRWYDGYSFKSQKHVYCPNSVVNAMFDGEFNSYWTGTAAYESLKYYITLNKDGLKTDIVRLLAGERCTVNSETFENDLTKIENKDHVMTLLIHLGYLGYDAVKSEVYIPNFEVQKAFTSVVNLTDWEPVIHLLKASDRLLRDTWSMDADGVAAGIENAHMEFSSILKYNDENSLRCVLRLGYYNAINEYTVIDELPTGKGYADVAFLPRPGSDKPALVVELKYGKTAEGAIAQIKKKQYTKKLETYKGNILLVAINYDKDSTDKKHTCIIEKTQK